MGFLKHSAHNKLFFSKPGCVNTPVSSDTRYLNVITSHHHENKMVQLGTLSFNSLSVKVKDSLPALFRVSSSYVPHSVCLSLPEEVLVVLFMPRGTFISFRLHSTLHTTSLWTMVPNFHPSVHLCHWTCTHERLANEWTTLWHSVFLNYFLTC